MRSLIASVVLVSILATPSAATKVPAIDIPEAKVMIGVQVITVDTLPAKFTLNLPDIIRPGDRITGTASAEPKGRTATERANNLSALRNISLRTNFSSGDDPDLDWDDEEGPVRLDLRQFLIDIPDASPQVPLEIKFVQSGGSTLKNIGIPIDFGAPRPAIGELPVVRDLIRPFGQQGRPHNASGSFDGDGRNTQITINNSAVPLLAESPRGVVFVSPDNTVGPLNVTINDGGRITQGTYRNIGVNLSAPKLELKKGESTTLTVQVTGLGGIRQDVPIWIVKSGAVSMEGGDHQHYMIRPGDIRSDGTYVTTRRLTGVVAGGFGITATVVDPTWRPFMIPLIPDASTNGYKIQSDGKGSRLIFDGVRHPLTGKPLDGRHQLDAGCGVPVLSKLPLLGALFKNGNAKTEKQECMLLIAPRIIVMDE